MDTASIGANVDQVLVRERKPGQIVVLDILSTHNAARVRARAAWAACGLLFLVPCSPDFNPSEQAWSKIKQGLRSAAASPREALEAAFVAAPNNITGRDAAAWLRHCRNASARV